MSHLLDFLPVEAAMWLEQELYCAKAIRVAGPPGSGRTELLTAFVDTVGDHALLTGLSDTPGTLACLRHQASCMTLNTRGCPSPQDALDLALRFGTGVVVVDDPSASTWSLLHDIGQAGPRIWASSADDSLPLDAAIRVQLGTVPGQQVEQITRSGSPVYWLANGHAIFDPPL